MLLLLMVLDGCLSAPYTYTAYSGSTGLGWSMQSWSYGGTDINAKSPVRPGEKTSVRIPSSWSAALMLHGSLVMPYGSLDNLTMWVNGQGGGTDVYVSLGDPRGSPKTVSVSDYAPITKDWTHVSIPFSAFRNGTEPSVDAIIYGIKVVSPPVDGNANASVAVTDVALSAHTPRRESLSVKVDTNTLGRVLPKELFGVNFGDVDTMPAGHYTANRWGGNAITRYNWKLDVQNRADDWYFEDIANKVYNVSLLPANSSSDQFVALTRRFDARALVTVPTIGFSPRDRETHCGFSVKKYGPQQKTDPYRADCGNGMKADGSALTGNDPKDTSMTVGPNFAVEWLDHLAETFGSPFVDGGAVFILDNEPNYWAGTHRDVHPKALTYDELWSYTSAYASAIKAKYKDAVLAGPDISGYCDLVFSPSDGCNIGPDRKAHGNLPLMEWYLKQVAAHEKATGVRLVDVLDVHCYADAILGPSQDLGSTLTLLRSVRELWDLTFTAESWYQLPVGYLRQMKQWIDAYTPGMGMSCTEYNYGGDASVAGAVATVNALGVYAREGITVASRWTAPAVGSIAQEAYTLWRNYDGQGAAVAGTLAAVTSDDADFVEAFAFVDTDALYVVLVCKQLDGALPVTVDVSSFAQSGSATDYLLDKDHHVEPGPAPLHFTAGILTTTLTPVSATLLVVSRA